MSNSENSREDIERSSEEILEETMREIRDDLQSSSQDDVSNASSEEEDDGVIRAVYGPVSIVANLTMKPLIEDSIRIAPGGFLARSDDGMIAGSDFVREDGKVWLFAPPGTIVSLPGTEGKSFKLDDGTILACRDGAFRLPAESGEYPRLWTGELQ